MDRKVVTRRLLFVETLEAQIKSNLKNTKCRKGKRSAVSCILGDREILKKYKVMKEIKTIVMFPCV